MRGATLGVGAGVAGLVLLLSGAAQAAVSVTETGFIVSTWVTGIPRADHMAFDAQGNLFVGDTLSNKVFKVDTSKVVSTWQSGLSLCGGVVVAPDGAVIISDAVTESSSGTGILYRSTSSSSRTVLSTNGPLVDPLGMAFVPQGFGSLGGKLLVADWNALGGPGAVHVVDYQTGVASVFAQSSGFTTPTDVAFTADGRLFAVDETTGFFQIASNGTVTKLCAGGYTAVAIHPSTGEIFATGSNGIEKVFRLTVSGNSATFKDFAIGFNNISDYSGGLEFTPDGGTLLVGDDGADSIVAISGFPKLTAYVDDDGDGVTENQGDCNDADATIRPGKTEVCDGKDQNCNNTIDEGFDQDGDGYTSCGGDCNDSSPAIRPTAVETCDGVDQDCDGNIDDGFDLDGDGFTTCNGDCDDTQGQVNPTAVEVPYDGIDNDCSSGDLEDVDEDGYLASEVGGDDCDDTDPDVSPGQPEIPYDQLDNDCQDGDETDVDGDGIDATQAGGTDCVDTDSSIFPGATEICADGIDQNCSSLADEGFDQDGDGHLSAFTCAQGDDCQDQDAAIHPGASEVCDGIDQDCDDLLDEGFADLDQDGQADCVDEDQDGDGFDRDADCQDLDSSIYPGATEVCDGIDQSCDGIPDDGFADLDQDGQADCVDPDQDGDGYAAGEDCQDRDASIHPMAEEACDGIDQDCDEQIDEGFADLDQDGVADCVDPDQDGDGYASGEDCQDREASIHPGAEEACDGIDQDCDAQIDEGFADLDQDGQADCVDEDQDGDGFAAGEDCQDQDASIHPGAEETCDGIDQDCDTQIDEGFDGDGDGYLPLEACAAVGGNDCDDAWAGTYPGAEERCDNRDNDCDQLKDEGFADLDQDGQADCLDDDRDGDGVAAADDCDDTDASSYPGAPEQCDGVDQDCDGEADNGFDQDGDGHLEVAACPKMAGDDCDDEDAAVYPGASEQCNGVDDDCDTLLDEGFDQDGDGVSSCPGEGADCDDTQEEIYPGALESCGDGIDQDCDGQDAACEETPTPAETATPEVTETPAVPTETPVTTPSPTEPPSETTPPDADPTTPGDTSGGGCSCDTRASAPSSWSALLLLGALGRVIRRRRLGAGGLEADRSGSRV